MARVGGLHWPSYQDPSGSRVLLGGSWPTPGVLESASCRARQQVITSKQPMRDRKGRTPDARHRDHPYLGRPHPARPRQRPHRHHRRHLTWTTRPASPSGPWSTPACSAPSLASSPSPRPSRATMTSWSPTTSSWSRTPPGSTPTSACRRPRSGSCGSTTASTTTRLTVPRPAETQPAAPGWDGTPRDQRRMTP